MVKPRISIAGVEYGHVPLDKVTEEIRNLLAGGIKNQSLQQDARRALVVSNSQLTIPDEMSDGK